MKTLIKTLLFIIIPLTYSFGQESHNKEIGIRINSLDNYDLLFKKKVSENTYHRLRLASAGINLSGGEFQDTRFGIGGNLAIGLEKRKALTDRFNFIYGFEGILGATYNRRNGEGSGTYRAGVAMVLGWNYKLDNNITLGVEMLPSLTYSTNFGDFSRTHNINAGFSTSAASLTATYGF